MKKLHYIALGVITVMVSSTVAQAACTWKPERAVTYVIPWGAGGGTDANSRVLASMLQEKFGVPFNPVNRTGGNGVVGHSAIATADPDGYTIGSATVEITMMSHLGITKLNQSNITPIALVDIVPAAVFVGKESPFKTLKDVLDYAKKNPGKLTASGAAQGGIWHLALAGLLQSSGLPADAIRWVPSEGAAPALQELIAGGVDVATPSLSEGKALVEAGEIRALAVMNPERLSALPNVPTTKEAAGTDWSMSAFITVSGPEGLPKEIQCSYEKAVLDIFNTKKWADFKVSRGSEVVKMGSADLTKMLTQTYDRLGAAMKAVGVAK